MTSDCPTFDVMQTKRLRKLVESVLGWTVDEDAEIDEYDEVSICHLPLLLSPFLPRRKPSSRDIYEMYTCL